tara:strand:- start:131130 stop:132965 length:1836 start_codon:yes stop_codon:yes gene_type:complete
MKNRTFFVIFCMFATVLYANEIDWNPAEPFTSQNILNKVGKSPATIMISDPLNIEGNVDIPIHVTLNFKEGGMLVIKSEASSLTIKGPILAKQQQIFDVSARGVTSYKFESISNITMFQNKIYYPEWWGVFPNVVPGQNGNTLNKASHHLFLKEMMLDVGASGGGEIHFSEGVYYIRDLVIDYDNIHVIGAGKERTILRFDRKNYKYSTRRGGLITIQGPTLEKYYSQVFTEGVPLAGNYSYTEAQKTIENISFRNMTIEWHPDATTEDPSMNGVAVVNAKNVVVDSVHVNLYGANRAFFIGSSFDGDVTENVTLSNSSCVESRTGVFLLTGYAKNEDPRTNLAVSDIKIINNHFKVAPMDEIDVLNPHIILRYLDTYASGIFFIGNEYTTSFTNKDGIEIRRNIGSFLIEGNTIENADYGIRSWYGNKDEHKAYVHDVEIIGNTFKNFRFIGVMAPFNKTMIKDNFFSTELLVPIPEEVQLDRGENHTAAAIYIAKAPWRKYRSRHGPENVTVQNNIIKGCFLNTNPIVIQPKEEGEIRVLDNKIDYDTSCIKPNFDVVFTTDRGEFRTKRATLIIGNNKDTSNQNPSDASLLLDVRRKKHITLIEDAEK